MKKPYIIVKVFDVPQGDIAVLSELQEDVRTCIEEGYKPLGAPFRFDDGWAQAMIMKEM